MFLFISSESCPGKSQLFSGSLNIVQFICTFEARFLLLYCLTYIWNYCSFNMAAKYIIGSILGSFAVAYVCDELIAEKKIFGGKNYGNWPCDAFIHWPFLCVWTVSLFWWAGTTPSTVSNKEWWAETDKKFQAWPRVAGPPVVMNPISRQNFIVKSSTEAWRLCIFPYNWFCFCFHLTCCITLHAKWNLQAILVTVSIPHWMVTSKVFGFICGAAISYLNNHCCGDFSEDTHLLHILVADVIYKFQVWCSIKLKWMINTDVWNAH